MILLRELKPDFEKLKDLLHSDYDTFVNKLGTELDDPKVIAAIKAGFQDGDNADDKMQLEDVVINIDRLIPTQREIDMMKSLLYPLSKKPELCTYYLSNDAIEIGGNPIVVFNNKYIIDGHHRWSQVYCLNPEAKMKAINMKSNSIKDPMKVLKAVQMSIAIISGDIPKATVEGTNLLTADFKTILTWIANNITDSAVDNINKEIGKENKTEAIKYISGNIKHLRDNATPIPNAPDRSTMPQTDEADGALQLTVSGTINFMNPLSK